MSFYIFFTLFSLPRTIRRNQFNSNTHKHNIENAILWTKILSKNICDRVYLCLCVNAPIIYSTSIFNTLKFLDLNSTTDWQIHLNGTYRQIHENNCQN